ncbi:hypothetical protein SOCEGT47_036000 [Sorangium cellulosum]|uniref:Uncharacterized protein n=1 Tax=Sorangium cellulosum TaxID=56 RepID=A0A4P2Q1V7_SORCE|nr:hypothetical protein [Sorangium cellulosum]AUX23081.1 hypothetical protein SOCEGT47_036000 [Sorangium cellulosum]
MSTASASECAAPLQDNDYRAPLLPVEAAAPVALVTRSASVERASRAAMRPPLCEPPSGSSALPSLIDQVPAIIALRDDPVLRNLLITQCYHDLSVELVSLLGGRNAHWCTFATWASKTAGRFIRNEEVPEMLRWLILSDGGERGSLPPPPRASGVRMRTPGEARRESSPRLSGFDLTTSWWGHGLGLMDLPERILDELSSDIALGNLKVFEELGPLFAQLIELYRDSPEPDAKRFDAVLQGLRQGPSAVGGQGLLRSAVEHYHEARLTDDPDRKAELILLANARVGLHEQIRLQPYIARALNAPIRCVRELFASPERRLPERLLSFVSDKIEKLQAVWRTLATKEMMTMRLSGELLELGSDLPPPPGSPLHCKELASIEERELYELLREYDAHDHSTSGCGAEDWASLRERMSYILELFRSRQSCSRLLDRPFNHAQHAEIAAWRVPLPIHGEL